jgi:hypothetical protein
MSAYSRHNLRKLRKYSGRLNRMMEDGSFEELDGRHRDRLVSRLRRLCRGLAGIVPEVALRHILAAAAVVVLGVAGCGGGGGQGRDADADAIPDMVSDLDAVDPADTSDPPLDPGPDPDAVEDPTPDGDEDPTPDAGEDPTPDAGEDPTPDAGLDADADAAPDADDALDMDDAEGVSTITPAFATPSRNPFGITLTASYIGLPELADLDGDGDLDILAGTADLTGSGMVYYQNTGSSTSPAFASPTSSPFGITTGGVLAAPALVDIDGDGDLDLFTGQGDTYASADIMFYRNTGSSTSPAFASPTTNPFSITAPTSYFVFPELADLDGDGDQDLMCGTLEGDIVYYQNTGSSTSPSFATPVTHPFGLTAASYVGAPALGDLDRDGDLDLFMGEQYGNLRYYQNTGSATSPAFAASTLNPFGLVAVDDWAFPDLGDLDTDGDLDLMVGEYDGYFRYFENTAI